MLPTLRATSLLLATALLAGCGKHEESNLPLGLRIVERRKPTVGSYVLPFGENGVTAFVREGDGWRQLTRAEGALQQSLVGDSLAWKAFAVGGDDAVFMLREGQPPLRLSREECPEFAGFTDPALLVCTGCGARAPLFSLSSAHGRGTPCPVVSAMGYGVDGARRWSRTAALPALPDACSRMPVLETWRLSPGGDPLYSVFCRTEGGPGRHLFFALTERGFEAQPEGVARESGH
jgi:hypothetical protein